MTAPTQHYVDELVTIWHGNCLEVLRGLPDESIDAIVTDPPYGLAQIDDDDITDALLHWLNGDRDHMPATGAGFMGKSWDAFVPPPAVWDECRRILKPGGHLLAFAGSRTHDLMALAIRLAGFEIRDSIAWLYGSGFPKSLDVSQSIDKLDASTERRTRALEFTAWMRGHLTAMEINNITGTAMGSHFVPDKEQPSVATAELFDQLRPHLPEVPARIEHLVAERTVESQNYAARAVVGTHRSAIARGAAGVTAAGDGKARTESFTDDARSWEGWGTALKPAFEPIVVARKPLAGTVAANVLEHGTGALNIDATRTATDDQWAGTRRTALGVMNDDGWRPKEQAMRTHDAGRWPANVALDESQAAALDEQTGVLTSGANPTRRSSDKFRNAYGEFKGQTDIQPARGTDSGGASRFFPTFRYEAKAPTSERPKAGEVQHPTVKPLDLMRWLVRLVTPPNGVVLEPFAGSGTTVEAALLEGFRCIAIEREADYLPLIKQRIRKPLQQSLFGDWDEAAS